MAQRKPADYMTQREKFIESARKLGVDERGDKAFLEALRKIATAPPQKAKTAVREAKR